MHPILLRVPLPQTPTHWYIVVGVIAGLAIAYAAYSFFVLKQKAEAGIAAAFGAAVIVARLAVPQVRDFKFESTNFPIYSYGVMLGLSLVVGWFLTLGLAERDGLPREQMGDCYVDTAIMAVIGSRVLYILTNLDQFQTFGSMFAMRSGGLVAYGGFLGGLLGSYIYLRFGVGILTTLKRVYTGDIKNPWRPLPLLPWADVAVPSLASGLMITRIGCYLFGCDFGKTLCKVENGACVPGSTWGPAWLTKLGSFPHWADKTLENSDGAPAWAQHVARNGLSRDAAYSFPVHPTQLYESLVGASLLVLLLTARKRQKFRGEIFFLFFFAYGICRYLLETVRDDAERGSLPPALPSHILIPLGLAIFAIGYAIGFSQEIKNLGLRRATQVAAFLPTIIGYIVLKPESFGDAPNDQWSTSQFIGMATGLAGCIGFNILYRGALVHPERAMDLGLIKAPPPKGAEDDEDDDDDDDDAPPPPPKKKVTPKAKVKAKPKPVEDEDDGEEAEDDAKKPVEKKTEAAKDEAPADEAAAEDKAKAADAGNKDDKKEEVE
jgi:phosphatidylglycerol:prolipoprotein diacylglycerol transferase